MRVTNLPTPYADSAPVSCRLLQTHITEAFGINARQVHMARDWVNRDRTRAWAFLEVVNDGAPLRIEWSHDSRPGMMVESVQITIDTYPHLVITNIQGLAHSESQT